MDVLTVHQAGKYCGVSPKTISNWIDEGHIKAFRTVGGHRRILQKDLDLFLRRQGMPIPEEFDDGGRKRILVVDDDTLIAETIVRALKDEPFDYDVESASDGFDAGIKVKSFKPDLLILDIMMPGINGYEVCRRVKDDPTSSHVKIVVLSAYLDDAGHATMKANGADECFCKPLPLERLKANVARLLGAS